MKPLLVSLLSAAAALLAAGELCAAEDPLPLPDMAPAVRRDSGRLSFELLPKAFQKNPQLEMTAVTEFTDFGRTLPLASAEHPIYYLGSTTGYQERGESIAGLHPPDPNYLARVLRHALDASGLRAADKAHPPSLALFFHWGAHTAMDLEMAGLFSERSYRELSERALLVGGRAFQKSLMRRFSYGEIQLDATGKHDFLLSQASADLYFVVVSAYDLASLRQGQRKLAWRTSLTVGASGVAMVDSLPALILTGGPYFGRPMPEAEILLRTVKRGVVTLGPTQVMEGDVPLPSAPAPKK